MVGYVVQNQVSILLVHPDRRIWHAKNRSKQWQTKLIYGIDLLSKKRDPEQISEASPPACQESLDGSPPH